MGGPLEVALWCRALPLTSHLSILTSVSFLVCIILVMVLFILYYPTNFWLLLMTSLFILIYFWLNADGVYLL